MMRIIPIAVAITTALPASAAASGKDQLAYETMTGCFAGKAKSLNDQTTPLADLAEVVVGMCWEEVNENRRRWLDDCGSAWAAFVGPYFSLHVAAKAKEAVYTYRVGRHQ